METQRRQSRDDRNGRYTFDGDMTRMCVCGHRLGVHAGGAPHECFISTFSKSDPDHGQCDCPKFRLSRRNVAKRI